ncbi:hypothetical protein TELCIR_19049, partial [Teladorsagia circumcincta]
VLVFVNNPPDLSIEHNQRRMLGLVPHFLKNVEHYMKGYFQDKENGGSRWNDMMYSFYVDQLDSIGSNTISTVIVAAITMDLACFLMIPHASSIVS